MPAPTPFLHRHHHHLLPLLLLLVLSRPPPSRLSHAPWAPVAIQRSYLLSMYGPMTAAADHAVSTRPWMAPECLMPKMSAM